jgi:stage II sporulation protein D
VCLAVIVSGAVVLSAAEERTLRVSIDGRVMRVKLEDYVARVVAGEGQPKAAEGAQRALAITARTFALANLNRHRRAGFNLCDTTHCQVLRTATDASRRAAENTAGRILVHRGQPAALYYSALCGGHSELASQVWPGADDSTSHLHEDEACRDDAGWTSDLKAREIEAALRAAGYRGNRVRDIRILQRNSSGRVTRVFVDGFGSGHLSGHEFRMAINGRFGAQQIKSTAFDVRWSDGAYRFTGSGYGHGVGLCVIGAGRRAERGASAEEILKFYYPNLTLRRWRDVVSVSP